MKRFFFRPVLLFLSHLAIRGKLLLGACALTSLISCSPHQKPLGQYDISPHSVNTAIIYKDILVIGTNTQGAHAFKKSIKQADFLWKMQNKNKTALQDTTEPPIKAIAYSSKTQQALTASGNNLVIWDTKTGESLHYLIAPAVINAIAIHPSGSLAILGLQNNQAKILNLKIGGIVQTLQHKSPVLAVGFSKDYLLTGEEANAAHLWTLGKEASIHTQRHNDGVTQVGFSPNGRYALTASRYDQVNVLDLGKPNNIIATSTVAMKAKALKAGKRLVDFQFKDHQHLLLAYSDHTVEEFDTKNNAIIQSWNIATKTTLAKDNSAVVALGQFKNAWQVLNSQGQLFEISPVN